MAGPSRYTALSATSRSPWIAPQGAAAVTIVLPYSRRTRAVIAPGRKETIIGTNESKTVHRVGRRFDAQP